MKNKKLIFFCILLAVIAGGIIYWTNYKNKLLHGGIRKMVFEQSNGLYKIKSDTVILDEIQGFLSITNLSLKSDSLVYDTITLSHNQPSVLTNLQIPSLTIRGVKTPKALLSQEIEGSSVVIESPVIELLVTGSPSDTVVQMSYNQVYRQILGNFKHIKVDSLLINNAVLLTRDLHGKNYKHQLDSVDIHLFDIQIDSVNNQDTSRFLFAKDMHLFTKEVKILSGNSLYRYVIKNVLLSTFEQKLNVEQFSINPLEGETAFMKNFRYQQDRFDIDMFNIELKQLNIPRFISEEIDAQEMQVGKSSFKIYRDMTYPRAQVSKVGNYPHQMLMNELPFKLFIRKAIFKNSFIEYKERAEGSGEAGRVQFKEAGATIDYLTNIKEMLPSSGIMTLDFHSKFLGQVPLTATLQFYNASKDGKWSAKGHLRTLDAKIVNQLTEPMGLARVEDGIINSLTFNLTGNDYRAHGDVLILYKDLQVSLLKQNEDNDLERKKFISWVANLKLKSNNPKKEGREPRRGKVNYERDIHRSFFALLWKSIFDGIKQCVGF